MVAKRNRPTTDPLQGEIWWAEALDKRRPVLIVTRNIAIPVLSTIAIAPITRTIRRIPTEIPLGQEHGLDEDCAASFDNLQPIRKTLLTNKIGQLLIYQGDEICRAFSALADC